MCSSCHPRIGHFKLGKIQNGFQDKKRMKRLFYENRLKELALFSQAESREGYSCSLQIHQGGKTKGARGVIESRKIIVVGEQINKTDHKES